jgi:hypothetical protein
LKKKCKSSCKPSLFLYAYGSILFLLKKEMGLEARFNKWLVGAVMGKQYVLEHQQLGKERSLEEQKVIGSARKDTASLKGFFQ